MGWTERSTGNAGGAHRQSGDSLVTRPSGTPSGVCGGRFEETKLPTGARSGCAISWGALTMTTFRTRVIAAGTTLLVAAAAAFGAAGAALATPVAAITITPSSATPGIWDDVSFQVQFGELDSSCLEGGAAWNSWYYTTGSSWETGSQASGSFSLEGDTISFDPLGNGYSLRFTVSLTGCDVPSETATIGNDFTQYYAYGYVYTLESPYGWGQLVEKTGVTVDLLEVSGGPTGTPVATATSAGSNAAYTLNAPFESDADLVRTYKIRFTYPDGGPVLYYDENAYPGGPGTTSDWDSATVGGPGIWVNTSYDSYAHIDAEWAFTGSDTIGGVVYAQSTPYGTSESDYSVVEGAFVRLVDSEGGTVDSDTTDSDGLYQLTAPVETEEQVEASYVIEVTYPDESVWYYLAGASFSSPSATGAGDATTVSPSSWGEAGRAIFAGLLPLFSETDYFAFCDESDAPSEDWETDTVLWEDICFTDGSVDDAETLLLEHGDAFDDFGYVKFPDLTYEGDGDDYYYATADSDEQYYDTEGAHYDFVDEDAWVYNAENTLVNVDIVVTRVISGSWIRWNVNVYYAGTEVLADAPFLFEGNLGSDDDTVWLHEGGLAVSHDTGDGDPIVLHAVNGADEWYTEDGDDDSEVWAAGDLEYIIGLVEYGCGFSEDTIQDAIDILVSIGTTYGTDLDPVSGSECAEWSIPTQNLTVGEEVDVTFTAPEGAPWNWNWGGWIEVWDLPAGLDYEVLNSGTESTPPTLRIFGTPEESGEFEAEYELWDDYDGDFYGSIFFVIAAADGEDDGEGPIFGEPTPPRDLDLELDLEIGDQIEGSQATATATGLEEGEDYDVTVHSTPQQLAAGLVPTGGTVVEVVTLPTLDAGWHRLVFTSTWAGGGAAVATVWFQVSPTGTLLAISYRNPALAATGQDASGTVFLASVMLLVGFGLIALRRRGAFIR